MSEKGNTGVIQRTATVVDLNNTKERSADTVTHYKNHIHVRMGLRCTCVRPVHPSGSCSTFACQRHCRLYTDVKRSTTQTLNDSNIWKKNQRLILGESMRFSGDMMKCECEHLSGQNILWVGWLKTLFHGLLWQINCDHRNRYSCQPQCTILCIFYVLINKDKYNTSESRQHVYTKKEMREKKKKIH